MTRKKGFGLFNDKQFDNEDINHRHTWFCRNQLSRSSEEGAYNLWTGYHLAR